MIDSAFFIGAIIIAFTKAVKILSPTVSGIITMLVAVVVGIIVALVDTQIGLANISVAQGILIAIAAIGVHTTATNVNTNLTNPRV